MGMLVQGRSIAEVIVGTVKNYANSTNLYVDGAVARQEFGEDLAARTIEVDISSQLLIGFSFGSDSGKTFFAWPSQVEAGFQELQRNGFPWPRGFFFWNSELDGSTHVNGTDLESPLWMARGLN